MTLSVVTKAYALLQVRGYIKLKQQKEEKIATNNDEDLRYLSLRLEMAN